MRSRSSVIVDSRWTIDRFSRNPQGLSTPNESEFGIANWGARDVGHQCKRLERESPQIGSFGILLVHFVSPGNQNSSGVGASRAVWATRNNSRSGWSVDSQISSLASSLTTEFWRNCRGTDTRVLPSCLTSSYRCPCWKFAFGTSRNESSHGWLVNLESVAGLVSLHEFSGQDGDRLARRRRINYADCLK
jgi:hypothetical protein